MNPDFPSPMPPMAGDAEQLEKEGHGDQVLDRPECLPAFRVPSLIDRVAIVQLGFRSRPLRDGGGKPSPGRLNPPFRRISPLATLGALIMTLARPWIDKVRMSLASGATTHPFQEADLEELRAILGPRHLHERCPGQPFLLDLVSHLASLSGDPDWEFPLTLKEGVPLGVSDPTLTSPGVWPTKEELKGEAWLGEDPPPPVAHDNYPTAELFAEEIESTFYEERALDMVDGPFTRSEAAERCRCKPDELCPGPLAGIDESDKIRTIYDGSKGGANAHIQAHTAEKTTAPMVGDCLHAIHWLRTAADHPHLLWATLPNTEERLPGAEGPERDPRSTSLPPRAEGPDRGRGLWIPPAAWTSPWDRHPQERDHSQVPRALIGGPPSPHPPRAWNALGRAGEPLSWQPPTRGETFIILKADVTKAHRRIKVLPKDWKYQVACIQNRWWVNRVGTYGMASAQLYWGRKASLVLRLLYYIFPQVDWHLVFVDDYCWVLRCSRADWDRFPGRRRRSPRSIPGWVLWWTQSRPVYCWLQSNMS